MKFAGGGLNESVSTTQQEVFITLEGLDVRFIADQASLSSSSGDVVRGI